MFTRQHYQKIAETLAECNCDEEILHRFKRMFMRDNPRFDPQKFIEAFELHYLFVWGDSVKVYGFYKD
tara:strand:- start:1090 stop:1293 length:204 start_codon:yes stop_codon:yes gene_type:complete